MNRRFFLSLLILLGTVLSSALAPVAAQDDGLNLPTELYVLENDGVVTRYGIGAAGITDVTPADAFVLDFAVAPSDNHIAYRTEQGLSLKPLFSDDVLTIEAESASLPPIRGRGDTLVWTADASALAYTTLYGARVYFLNSQSFADISQANVVSLLWSPDSTYLAVEAQNPDPNAQSSFWWIYRRDNLTFTLVSAIPSSIGIAWQSSARIIFAPETGGLYAMDLSAGNAQTELFDASTVYRMPYVRDDSTVTAFANVPASEATAMPESSGITGRLVALVNGEPVETGAAPIDIDRVRWAPRGDLLIAFRGGALALVNPASGLAFSLPLTSAVAYGWGPLPPASVSGVDMPANGYFLSDFSTGVAQLWQLPADGSAAFPFTLMEDPLTEFAVSPDEQQVVFVSGGALWLQDIDPNAQPVSLATLENGVDVTPVFNASGDQIAYADNGIWLVSTAGGEATEVLDGDNNHPLFAPNVNALLVNNLDSGLGVLDLAAGVFNSFTDADAGFWLSDGRIAALSDSTISIYDLSTLPTPAQVITLPDTAQPTALSQPTGEANLRLMLTVGLLQFSSLNEVQLGAGVIVPLSDTGYLVAPVLSPDGSFVVGYRYQRTDANGVARGPLLFVNVDSGERVVLSFPSEAWAFQWGQ